MKNKSEKVFCYPDTLQNRYLPQAWQIFIMKNYLDPFEKKIDFYTGENHKSFKNMKIFEEKVKSNPNIHGFIFFSLLQFCYDKKVNIGLIDLAVKKGYTIYLAREKIVINKKNLKKKKDDLFFFKFTNNSLINTIKKNFEK
tara:strand:+ start:2022 stop:2444 length:423 start_codon:yes stop_codon:yes gene_type:complete